MTFTKFARLGEALMEGYFEQVMNIHAPRKMVTFYRLSHILSGLQGEICSTKLLTLLLCA